MNPITMNDQGKLAMRCDPTVPVRLLCTDADGLLPIIVENQNGTLSKHNPSGLSPIGAEKDLIPPPSLPHDAA